jgi:lipoprotein-anchoring transpeptidase ErfK/SrfK
VQALGSRRGGWITLAIVALAVVVAAIFAAFQLLDRPGVDAPLPAPGSAVAQVRPTISFAVDSGDRLGDLQVMVDGVDVTGRARAVDGRVTVTSRKLAEGEHAVRVSYSSDNLISRTVARNWSFAVDTAAPKLIVASPRPGSLRARRAVKFEGRAEPGADVSVAFTGGSADASADGAGAWSAIARLPEGLVTATVTASDAAGNTTERERALRIDTTAPAIAISAPAKGAQLTETDQPLVYGTTGVDNPRALTFSAAVNGKTVATAKGSSATSPDDADPAFAEASGTTAGVLEVDGRRFAMAVGTLPQGRNRIAVTARDRAGNVARTATVVLVNSTEEFGEANLAPGARGKDVTALQERLREAKVYPKKGKLTGVLDGVTEKSVIRYQKRYKTPKTGVVDRRMRTALVGRLVATLSQMKVRLIRNGKVVMTFPIAIGQPAYPTPTGEYEINDKQVDPAWYPPASPWAAELSSIPPGPGNPLGTRWIGTSAPAIGLHGTYADYSVGTAASHGCMRMHIPDVEKLYDQVTLGMPISIRA